MIEEYAVVVDDLAVKYDDFTLKIDNYKIPKGYVTGLIGRTGSGKSTFIRSVLSIIEKNYGDVSVLGMNFTENEIDLKNQIGYVNDTFIFPENYSPEKVSKKIMILYENFDETYYKTLCKKFKLNYSNNFKTFSKGQKALFQIVFAITHNPKILFLDEPTANLDPISRQQVLDLLYEIMEETELTILFSTHITSDLDKIADYITLIDNGKIEFSYDKVKLEEELQIVNIKMNLIPKDMKKDLRGIKKLDDGYRALCIKSNKYQDNPDIIFQSANIEEIMVYWEANNESFK
jgi:ABC-2 type transport system ATP-binding protein